MRIICAVILIAINIVIGLAVNILGICFTLLFSLPTALISVLSNTAKETPPSACEQYEDALKVYKKPDTYTPEGD